MPKRMGTSSYSNQFAGTAVAEPVHPIRCMTEMSGPSGDMDLQTVTRSFPNHVYGRPAIAKPIDSGIFVDEFPEEASTRASSVAIANYQVPNVRKQLINNHHSGYDSGSRTVGSSLKWNGSNNGKVTTTNQRMHPQHTVTRHRPVDRNDFVKYVEFGFDTPVNTSLYGNDFIPLVGSAKSPVQRQGSTISLERSNLSRFEEATSYGAQFTGEAGEALPSLSEMDNQLRSSIEFK